MSSDRAATKGWVRAQSRLGRRAALPVVLLNLGAAVMSLCQAWCVASILAAALAGAGAGAGAASLPRVLPWTLPGFALAAVLRAALQGVGEILAARAGGRARVRLRHTTLTGILSAGPRLLRGSHSAALSALLVDRIEAVDGFFARYLPAATLAILGPLLVLLVAGLVQPFAALVLLCCGIVVPVLQAVFGIGAAAATRRQFQALSRLQTRFVDRMRGIATIVLAGRTEDEARRIADAASELRVRTMRVLRVAFLSSAGLDLAMATALVVIALHDGRSLLHPAAAGSVVTLPVSAALFCLLLVPEFFAPLRNFALAYQDRMQASACAEALAALPTRAEAPDVGAPQRAVPPPRRRAVSLAFEDVHYAWDAARGSALDGLSFRVEPGETVLLVGPSGAGKSTLIEMLLGFIRPDRGRVLIDGVDLHGLDASELSDLISWIGQKPVLFAGSLRDNILFARPDASPDMLDHALQVASLDSVLAGLPHGLDTVIGEGGYGLSGGQAQRVAIARAVLRDAPLLLLDEPTAHLDPLTERSILDSLGLLGRHRTVVMASHSAAARALGGRRLDLVGGRLAPACGVA